MAPAIYGMWRADPDSCLPGPAQNPRSWGAQLAGVLSIVSRAAAQSRGQEVDEAADAARAAVEAQIEAESLPMFLSGRLYDDGVIDPRDTRTVLGMCLSAIANGPIEGRPISASSGCERR